MFNAVGGDVHLNGRAAFEVLETCLTFDGRLPHEYGVLGLSMADRALYECLREQQDALTDRPYADDSVRLTVSVNARGRPHLREDSRPAPDYGFGVSIREIGHFYAPEHLVVSARALLANWEREEEELRAYFQADLVRCERESALPSILASIDDAVRHVEAVYFYLDDILCAAMEGFHTLVETRRGPGLLSHLKSRPFSDWTSTERLLLAFLYALYLSGRSFRFEEFNGTTISAKGIVNLFERLATNYDLAIDVRREIETLGVFTVARRIGEISSAPGLRYRWVNGLTFLKTERVARMPIPKETSEAIPDCLLDLYRTWVGKPPGRALGYKRLLTELADRAIERTCLSGVNDVETLIRLIVADAVLTIGADFGTSSSLRNPSPLIKVEHAMLLVHVTSLTPKDFYCCIVGSRALTRMFGNDLQSHVYRAVQARMQFNRWHFIVANSPHADVPEGRHYLHPPCLPDCAEWSDQHHGGHIRARVRYTIRAPGPDMSMPPLLIGAYTYRGFYDVRLIRCEGPPFTVEDMIATRHRTLWMGAIWDRILAYCASPLGVEHPLIIRGFELGQGMEAEEVVASVTGTLAKEAA